MQDAFDVSVKLHNSLYLCVQYLQEEDCLAGHMDTIHRRENNFKTIIYLKFHMTVDKTKENLSIFNPPLYSYKMKGVIPLTKFTGVQTAVHAILMLIMEV